MTWSENLTNEEILPAHQRHCRRGQVPLGDEDRPVAPDAARAAGPPRLCQDLLGDLFGVVTPLGVAV